MRIRTTEVYRDWIDRLRDRVARARIQVRVDRLVHGHPVAYRAVGHGVLELKIDHGPGYRVHYTQREDIALAIDLAGRLGDER